jgi:hypothetical protein
MFKLEGIPVHYSVVDNDDTIAAYADADYVDILS